MQTCSAVWVCIMLGGAASACRLGPSHILRTSMLPPSKWLLMVTLPAASVVCERDPVGTTDPSAHLRCHTRDQAPGGPLHEKGGLELFKSRGEKRPHLVLELSTVVLLCCLSFSSGGP